MIHLPSQVSIETSTNIDQIMLLRHANAQIDLLNQHNVSYEQYTQFQPVGGRFDFHHTARHKPITMVIVVIRDSVYQVYRIDSKHEIGSNHDKKFVGANYYSFQANRKARLLRKFNLTPIENSCVNQPVFGYAGRAIAAALHSVNPMFWEVCINIKPPMRLQAEIEHDLACSIKEGRNDDENHRARLTRLSAANPHPQRVLVSNYITIRNPDVIVETLFQAKGVCQSCKSPAPFNRRSDGTPYLEVHHRVPLSEGGLDNLENAIALCPNCHRRQHLGQT